MNRVCDLKKILILFSSSDIGGAERSLSRMALANSDSKIQYQLSTYGNVGAWSEWILNLGHKPICFNFKLSELIKYILSEKPDIVYVCGFRISLLLRFILPLIKDVELVQGVRWNPNSETKLDRVFRFFERYTQHFVKGYIANSKSASDTLRKFIKNDEKVRLIYNGIEPKKLISQANGNRVTTIANLSVRKGYKEYLKVIKIVVKKIPNAQFVFIGKDRLNGEIQQLIKEYELSSNIEYVGFQENVNSYLDESLVFVLPSLYGEGCPTTILEAFMHQIPVVAYKIDGIPELVTDGIDGFLSDVEDIESMAEHIFALLSNTNQAKTMGESGRQKVIHHFSLEKMTKLHNKYFLGA